MAFEEIQHLDFESNALISMEGIPVSVYRQWRLQDLRRMYPGDLSDEEILQKYWSDAYIKELIQKYGEFCECCGIDPVRRWPWTCSACDQRQVDAWRAKHPCQKYRHSGHSSIDCWD
jgi:hypothetical protein